MEQYALRGGLQPADALIAATAVENAGTLCSGNARHYGIVSDILLKVFRA